MTDPLTELTTRAARDIPAFAASLLRGRNVAGREVLARAISGGRFGDADLRGGALVQGASALPAEVDREGLAAYAYVLAVQLGTEPDHRAALGLFDALSAAGHSLRPREAELHAQLLLAAGRLDQAQSAAAVKGVRQAVRALTEADCRNPRLRRGEVLSAATGTASAGGAAAEDERTWVAALSAALVKAGTIPLALLPEGRTAFDRLTSAEPARAGSVRGPLVAVMMSAFNPDERLITAVRSMIDQTWRDWELLIVDDASPAAQPGVLERAEAMDERVRVIRKAVNGGTYRARNTALLQTGADFFTTLDSDDWAHPQRLEKGMEPLLADRALMATRSMGVRADENLVITRPGYHGHLVNAPSLLVRTYPAVHRIGLFDTVRKAADTEYALRLEAAFGIPVETLRADVLTMARHEETSLSFGEFAPGWRHEARSAYRQAYGRWHEEIRAGADPYLDPEAPRLFPGPARWQAPVDKALAQPRTLPVVVMADARAGATGLAQVTAILRTLIEARLRPALLHVEDLVAFTQEDAPLAAAVQEFVDAGGVERVFLEDDLRASCVLVADPQLLQFPPWAARSFPAERVLVRRSPDSLADPEQVGTAARELFGADAEWIDPDAALVQTLTTLPTPPSEAGDVAEGEAATAPDGDSLAALQEVEEETLPEIAGRAPQTWLTITTRRPGDGEHADALAVRHTADERGADAAREVARRLMARLPAGAPASAADLAAVALPGVSGIAQNLSGEVVRLTLDD